MRLSTLRFLLFVLMVSLLLSGCEGPQSTPAAAIEEYIQALASQDVDQLVNNSCADWEASARVELDSLTAVSSTLEGLKCQADSQDESQAVVTCVGKIVLDYNGELQEIDLTFYTYLASLENGQWRMCGYQ